MIDSYQWIYYVYSIIYIYFINIIVRIAIYLQ